MFILMFGNAVKRLMFIGAGVGLCVAKAQAEAQVPAPTLPKITVTGSHIPRIESETTSPTLVIPRSEIRALGVSSVKELLDTLTGSSQIVTGPHRSISDISGSNSFAAGGSSVSLRHLGHQSTLVLLNSRRLAAFAMDDDPGMFVNVDTLPLEAIERVEVLRSGASAIYGSDAVAGVINIITRRDFNGVVMRASREQSAVSRQFHSHTASLTTGVGDLATDRYNLLLNVELYRRSGVFWREVLDEVNPQAVRYAAGFGSQSTYSYSGNVAGAAVPSCAPENVRSGLCFYDRYARLQAQPAAQRANWLLSGELRLDAGLRGFSELLYSSTDTRYVGTLPAYGPPSASTWFDPRTGLARFFTERGLPKEHPLNPTGLDDADFRYRFVDANTSTRVRSNNYRYLVGLRGALENFSWESAIGTMGGTVDNRGRGVYSDSGFKQVIGDYTLPQDPLFFNRAYRIGEPNSAEVLNTLFPEFSTRGKNTQTFLDAKVSGSVGSWQDRPIEMAAGFELRHETMSIRPSENLASGDMVGYGVAQTEGRRTLGSVFGELSVPWTPALEMQAAARLDQYPGFAANLSPKLGLRFEATPQWMLRATVEGGFRAPNLTENAQSTRYSFDVPISDPKRCGPAQALANDLRASAGTLPDSDPGKTQNVARADIIESQECGRGLATVRRGNPDLQPEKSLAASAGLVFQPAAGHLASLDYWLIRRRNEIGYKTAQDLVNREDGLAAGVVNRVTTGGADPSFTDAELSQYGVTAGPLGWTVGQIENTAKTTTSGLDFTLQSRLATPFGVLSGGAQATYLINYYVYSPLRGGYGDNLAGRYQYPRLRGALSASLATRSYTQAFRLNVLSGTKLQGDFYDTYYSDEACLSGGWSISDCRVHRSSTIDYSFAYTGIRNLVLSLNVLNLLNRRPPVDLRAIDEAGGGIAPQDLRDVQRRTVRLAIEYKFF